MGHASGAQGQQHAPPPTRNSCACRPHASAEDVADFFPGNARDAQEALALLDDDGDGVVTLQVSAHGAILGAVS